MLDPGRFLPREAPPGSSLIRVPATRFLRTDPTRNHQQREGASPARRVTLEIARVPSIRPSERLSRGSAPTRRRSELAHSRPPPSGPKGSTRASRS